MLASTGHVFKLYKPRCTTTFCFITNKLKADG